MQAEVNAFVSESDTVKPKDGKLKEQQSLGFLERTLMLVGSCNRILKACQSSCPAPIISGVTKAGLFSLSDPPQLESTL